MRRTNAKRLTAAALREISAASGIDSLLASLGQAMNAAGALGKGIPAAVKEVDQAVRAGRVNKHGIVVAKKWSKKHDEIVGALLDMEHDLSEIKRAMAPAVE